MGKVSKIVVVVDLMMKGLDMACNVLTHFVTQTMFNQPMDEIALVLIGSKTTDVSMLTGCTENIDNICVVRDLIRGDSKLLHSLQSISKIRGVPTDVMSGLEVATRILHQDAAIKIPRQIPQRKFMLFTDADCIITEIDDVIVSEVNALNVTFKLIGPTLYDDCNTQTLLHGTNTTTSRLAQLCNALNGAENLNLDDALSCLSVFKKKAVKSMAGWKGCLEIGSNFKLPLISFIKVKKEVLPPFKCCTKDKIPVVRDRTYHVEDEAKTLVSEEHINKGYRYGKTFIPISKIDEGLMKLKTEKCLKLICTTKLSNIKKEELMCDTVHCLTAPPGDGVAGKAVGAFAAALKDSERVAIVRYVRSDNGKVVLGCLAPHVKECYSALLLIPLPFSNEIKSVQFPRIKSTITEQHKSAVDKLINNMDLTKTGEVLKPSMTFNPAIQRRFDCVVERAMNPHTPLTPPTLSKYLQIPSFSTDGIEECIAAFTLTVNEKNKKRRTADEMWCDDMSGVIENELKRVKKEELTLDHLLGTVDKSSTTVHNFSYLLKTLGPEKACIHLSKVILQSVQYSVSHSVILETLKTLRATCVEANTVPLVELFNTFLTDGLSNSVIKSICTTNKVSIIHRDECNVSSVSKEESDHLLDSHDLMQSILEEDDEDLLDMM